MNSKNAKTYSVKLRINYLEQHKDDYLLDISDGIIDPLRGNEILLRVGLLPGTNPIYQISISFTTMSDENKNA